MLGTTAALSGVMGVTLTMAIGGADMPGRIITYLLGVGTGSASV
jgi:NAD/NADP transhydrogenase beta subunit